MNYEFLFPDDQDLDIFWKNKYNAIVLSLIYPNISQVMDQLDEIII